MGFLRSHDFAQREVHLVFKTDKNFLLHLLHGTRREVGPIGQYRAKLTERA
jgi:hypothetical protein